MGRILLLQLKREGERDSGGEEKDIGEGRGEGGQRDKVRKEQRKDRMEGVMVQVSAQEEGYTEAWKAK